MKITLHDANFQVSEILENNLFGKYMYDAYEINCNM